MVGDCSRPSHDLSPADLTPIQARLDAGEAGITDGPWSFRWDADRASSYNITLNGVDHGQYYSLKDAFDSVVVKLKSEAAAEAEEDQQSRTEDADKACTALCGIVHVLEQEHDVTSPRELSTWCGALKRRIDRIVAGEVKIEEAESVISLLSHTFDRTHHLTCASR